MSGYHHRLLLVVAACLTLLSGCGEGSQPDDTTAPIAPGAHPSPPTPKLAGRPPLPAHPDARGVLQAPRLRHLLRWPRPGRLAQALSVDRPVRAGRPGGP